MKVGSERRRGEGNGGCLGAIGGLVVVGVLLYLFLPGVRVAVDRAVDSRTVVGKWKQVDGPLKLELFSDGTLREERPLGTGKGTYKLLSGERIELEIEGVLWGTNRATFRYTLTGDELLLSPEGGSGMALRYRRVR